MPHVQGIARDQVILYPPSLDEYTAADNSVRFLDAFVDRVDLQALGFQRVIPTETGDRPITLVTCRSCMGMAISIGCVPVGY
jgi:hypothetical protein